MCQGFWTSCWIARHCGYAGSEKWASTCSFAILDCIEWLGFSDLLSRFTVGLRQVGAKSLFGRHLCLFDVVSLDLLPFTFTIKSRREYRNSSDKVKMFSFYLDP